MENSSSGDGGDDSSDDDGKSDDSDEDSESDDAAPMTSSRGRATLPDRRNGSGGSAKQPKQKEAEPVSPPRQSVIAAAHNAEVGSQIKVKFDTGHWYSGTILKVDPQRCDRPTGWLGVWLVRSFVGFALCPPRRVGRVFCAVLVGLAVISGSRPGRPLE